MARRFPRAAPAVACRSGRPKQGDAVARRGAGCALRWFSAAARGRHRAWKRRAGIFMQSGSNAHEKRMKSKSYRE